MICLRDQLENSVYQNNFDKQLNELSLKLEKAIKLRDLHNKDLTEARRMFANQLEEKLNTLDNIHINLVRNFNLHLSICKSNNEVTAWQGVINNDPR